MPASKRSGKAAKLRQVDIEATQAVAPADKLLTQGATVISVVLPAQSIEDKKKGSKRASTKRKGKEM